MLKAVLNLPMFVLVATRITGIVLIAPVFSSISIPVRMKVAFVVLTALVMFPFASAYAGNMPSNVIGFAPLFVSELGMGLVMGFAGAMMIAGVEMAGNFISQQVGLALASIADPASGQSNTAISVFLSMITLLLFLAVNGHHWFIAAVGSSFRYVPLGTIEWKPALFQMYTANFSQMFLFMMRVSAPLVGLMFLVNIMMALISKAAPGIQILIVGYPVKMFAGLMLLAATFPLLWPVIQGAFEILRMQLFQVVKVL